jgi:hypothetical protein
MTVRNILAICVASSAITVLVGCGTNMEQRAATGAATGLIIAGPVGAAVGAVAGAVINEADEDN